MAEPGNGFRELLERLASAAAGGRRDEVRSLMEDALTRWRGDATRLSERASESMSGLFGQLGLVTREEFDELELRVAQLEHRLRLVEDQPKLTPLPPPR
jgi:polyhydroxyalkanoate synthesis regulator phasin